MSHEHPDGQVHFDAYADRKEDQDWGAFSTDSALTSIVPGPAYDGDGLTTLHSVHASKISKVRGGGEGEKMDSVLLARLRFRPDEEDPTRL